MIGIYGVQAEAGMLGVCCRVVGSGSATIEGMARVSSPVFVGRESERAVLARALQSARDGRGRAVFLGGEAGVGKTRLVREFVGGATDAHVAVGGCIDVGGGGVPFAPFVEALRRLARHVGSDHLLSVAGPARADLARLLPELSSDGGAQALPDPTRLFEVVFLLLEGLAADRPVVVVCEDIHWADQSTRDLLAYLVHHIGVAPVLLVATYRTDELHRRHPLRPLLAEVERAHDVDRLELGRFSRDELFELLLNILEADPDPDLFDTVLARSEGNAFFAEELVAATRGTTADRPTSLRDILLVRVERLPEESQEVLRVAAAAGQEVQHRLLASVAGIDDRRLAASLREAVAQQILEIDDGGSYRFRHALLRESVYEDLLPGERVELHAAFAAALDSDPTLAGERVEVAGLVAHHWYEAHELERAFASSVKAGIAAEQTWAFADAYQHFERALGLWTVATDAHDKVELDHIDLLARTAWAAALTAAQSHAIALIEQAIAEVDRTVDARRASHLLQRRGRYLWLSGAPHAALEAYEEALAVCPLDPSPERARALASTGQALMLLDRNREACERCREAITVAAAIGDRATEGHARNTLGTSLGALGRFDDGISLLREAAVIADEVNDLDDRLRASTNLSEALDIAGRSAEGIDVAVDGAALARRVGLHRGYGSYLLANAARFSLRLGRWDDAEEMAQQAVRFAAQAPAALRSHSLQSLLLTHRGDLDGAARHLEAVSGFTAQARDLQHGGLASQARAELLLALGKADEALAVIDAALTVVPNTDDAFYRPALCGIAVAAAEQMRDRVQAEAYLARLDGILDEHAGGEVPPLALAEQATATARARSLAGEDSADAWEAAAVRWAAIGDAFREADARQRWAASLQGDARREEVEAFLRAALETARRLGAVGLVRAVTETARGRHLSFDEPVRARATAGLTPREREVLVHLTEGHTNRQIADALFISDKTASVHVSNILAKLGVSNRGEAAAAARRQNLTE
jgi:DNA-binding CsgD family transcriptional regulator